MPVNFPPKQKYDISDLLNIIKLLRSGDGCPWDREQDHHSIRKNFLEETYEVIEAIDKEDSELLKEELGDVLMQVVFHAQMENEKNRFDFSDVCDGVSKKLIERHPHVFGDVTVGNSDEVLVNWDQIKRKTKGQKSTTETLKSVPAVLPALMRSEKVQHRAAKCGFDYPRIEYALKDLDSEIIELKEAIAEGNQEHIDEELGDLLFSVVNAARFTKTDAEEALSSSCEKFILRFEQVEKMAESLEIDIGQASIEELDKLWKKAKKLV